jgi:hypothetical protein
MAIYNNRDMYDLSVYGQMQFVINKIIYYVNFTERGQY